jgi:cell division protein DivIC
MRRKHKSRTGIGIISFVVLMMFGIIAYRKVGLEEQGEKDKLQISKLEAQIDEQKDRKTEINNLKAYMQTDKYIEDMAREKLGLVYKDEILFKAEDKSKND